MSGSLAFLVVGGVAGFVVAVPFGAISAVIAEAAISQGRRAAFSAVAGAAFGDVLHAVIAASGCAKVIAAHPRGHWAASVLGGAVLAATGALQLHRFTRPGRVNTTVVTVPSRFLGTFAMVLADPMTVVLFVASLSGQTAIAATGAHWSEWLFFSLGVFLGTLAWRTPLVLGLLAARRRLPTWAIRATQFVGAGALLLGGITFLALALIR